MTIVGLPPEVHPPYKGSMPFWNLRRDDPMAPPPDEPILGTPSDELEPIDVFGDHGVTEGAIDPMKQRMTELLNSRGDVRVNVPTESGAGDWQSFALAQLVAVAPPPHPSNPARRISRRRHRIVLYAGAYRIIGTAHLPPGTDVDDFLLRRPGWLPLTACTIGTSEAEYEVDVAIVNTARIGEVEPLLRSLDHVSG